MSSLYLQQVKIVFITSKIKCLMESFEFTVYEVYGKYFSIELEKSLNIIGSRYNPEREDRREIENTILSAIKHVEIAVVLKAVPLTDTKGEMSIDRSWMLPLLREGLRNSSLEYFHMKILPLASACLKKWKHFESAGKQRDSHIYELLCCQLWGLFPAFCRSPKDSEKFSLIARTAGMILSENLYLRAPILDGFKELIPCVITEGKEESVSKYVKNYLPILFNLYIIKPKGSYENDLRVSILDIIKLFLKITPTDSLNEMFNTAFNRLKATKEGDFAYNMLFDIIECFAVHLKLEQLDILYEEYVKHIFNVNKTKGDKNVQQKVKKAYRVICSILTNNNESCKTFVTQKRKDLEELLLKAENLNGDNVMLIRLKCLKRLMETANVNCDSELIKQCVTETVFCFPNNPEKPHQLCTEMLKILGTNFNDQGKLQEFIELILIGFTSDNTDLLIKTIWSINNILQFFSDNIETETLNFVLENIYSSVLSKQRMEAKSALCTLYTFIKHVSKATLTLHLEPLVKTICKMVPDTKRFCRLPYGHLLKKLCQYYSAPEIIRLVPGNDLITHKRLKKIRKELNRMKNTSNGGNEYATDDDEMDLDQKLKTITINDVLKDSDDSDENEGKDNKFQEKEKKDGKMELCIKEDCDTIVDLTDINAISKVSFKNKINKGKTREYVDEEGKITFKTASDGRLIIEEPKKNKKDFMMIKASSAVKRPLESDVSELDSDIEIEREKNKFTGLKKKKIVGIHRASGSATSVASGEKFVKASKSKESKKKWNSGKIQHMQPYTYLPFNGPHMRKKNK